MSATDFLTSMYGSTAGMDAAGTMLSAYGTIMQGQGYQTHAEFSAMSLRYQAEQLRQNASASVAQGTVAAYDANRQGQYIASKALAVAAGSGGGASDPGVVAQMSRLANENAYRTNVAVYNGLSRARLLNMQASAAEMSAAEEMRVGKQAGLASSIAGGFGMMKGISLMEKYGGPGPASTMDMAAFTDAGSMTPGVYGRN